MNSTNTRSTNSNDANVAVAALQKAFLDGQISAVVYEQARAGLMANTTTSSSNSSGSIPVAVATRFKEQPQPQMMTRSANDRSNMTRSANDRSNWVNPTDAFNDVAVLEVQVIDGVLTMDTPLPCIAYIFMAPFPFCCMGCCLYGASKVEFDDKSKQVTVKTWNGGCCGKCGNGHKSFVGSYEEITSFETRMTSTKINSVYQYDIEMRFHGVKPYNLGGMDPHSVALQKVRSLTSFINSRRTIPLQNPRMF